MRSRLSSWAIPAPRRAADLVATVTSVVALALLLAPRPAAAQEGVPLAAVQGGVLAAPERAAIRRVIEEQLEAFKRRDGAVAFGYAAPAIRELFGTPERFMSMVQREYPPIYRPKSFTFGDLEIVGGEFTQNVTVIGEDGVAASAFYLMSRQADGSWRILGCILVPLAKTEV